MSKKPVSFGIFCIIAALLVSLMTPALATDASLCSVTFKYPFAGSQIDLYYVGTRVEDGSLSLTDEFSGYPVDLRDVDAASTLQGYVQRDQLTPVSSAITEILPGSVDATATFSSLEKGVYLAIGSAVISNNMRYTPAPTLFQLPQKLDGAIIVQDVEIDGKFSISNLEAYSTLSVVKIWKDSDGNPLTKHPSSVRVQLLRDGMVVETIVLNKRNSWSYCWDNLDTAYDWFIVEDEVPEGYIVAILQDSQGCFTVTNILDGEPGPIPAPTPTETDGDGKETSGNADKDPGKRIPQTGQLWWPVSFLALGGLTFVVVGLSRRKRG